MPDSHIVDGIDRRTKLAESAPFHAAEIFEKAAPSVVDVGGHGTGFFVSSGEPNSCEIVTESHVTDNDATKITTRDGHSHAAKPIMIDKAHELTFYKLEDVQNPETVCKELVINGRGPILGQSFISIGARGDDGASATDLKYQTSTIEGESTRSKIYADSNWIDRWLTSHSESLDSQLVISKDRATRKGYSGGPWLDSEARVIGITFGDSNWKSFADSARFIQEDLDRIRAITNSSGGMVKLITIE